MPCTNKHKGHLWHISHAHLWFQLNSMYHIWLCMNLLNDMDQRLNLKIWDLRDILSILTIILHRDLYLQILALITPTVVKVWIWVSHCLMTPGEEMVSCITIFLPCLQITRSDIRPQVNGQSTWWLQMATLIFLMGMCGYGWVNTLALSPLLGNQHLHEQCCRAQTTDSESAN